jgi:hypothetical protein
MWIRGIDRPQEYEARLIELASVPAYNSPTVRFKRRQNMAESRKVLDCRRFPAEKPCSIAISGNVDEVVELGVLHASIVHGHQDTPELREQLRSMLQDDNAARAA